MRAVATAGDSPTVVNRVAANATYVDLCRRIVALDPTVEPPPLLAEACRKADITPSRLRARLNPVARALNLAPSGSNASYYQILGVPPDSDAETIRQAYRRRARALHPDRRPNKPADHGAFTELTTAYQTLSDPVAKKAYDRRLDLENTWYEPEPQTARASRSRSARFTAVIVVALLLVAAALVIDRLDRNRLGHGAYQASSQVVFHPVSPPPPPAASASPASAVPPEGPPGPTAEHAPQPQMQTALRIDAAAPNRPHRPHYLPANATAPSAAGQAPAKPMETAAPGAQATATAPQAALSPAVDQQRLAIFHAGADSARLSRQLAVRLSADGYPEADIGPTPEALRRPSSVRYFNAADRAAARRLRDTVRTFLAATLSGPAPTVQLIDLSRRYPRPEAGLLEVWLNTGAAPPPAAQARTAEVHPPEPAPPAAPEPISAGEPVDLTEAQIRAFIDDYCRAYETRDPDRLAALFDPAATENGQPFRDLLPRYRENMARLAGLSYRIDMARWQARPDSPAIAVEGRFAARGRMEDEKQYQSQGTIAMDIVPHGTSYRVVRLEYRVDK